MSDMQDCSGKMTQPVYQVCLNKFKVSMHYIGLGIQNSSFIFSLIFKTTKFFWLIVRVLLFWATVIIKQTPKISFFVVTRPVAVVRVLVNLPALLAGLLVEVRDYSIPRVGELCQEFPGVAKAIIKNFWPGFNEQLAVIAGFHALIFAVDMLVAKAASLVMKWVHNPEEWSYATLIGVMFLYLMVLRWVFEITLHYCRERFISEKFEYHFRVSVVEKCVRGALDRGLHNLPKNRQPAIIEGSGYVLSLTNLIIREVFVLLRGFMILFWMGIDHPSLFLFAVLCILIDLAIVLHMDSRMYALQNDAESAEFNMWGAVSRAVDGVDVSRKTDAESERMVEKCVECFDEYIRASAKRDVVKLGYDEYARNSFDQISDFFKYAILLVPVVAGTMEPDKLFWILGMLGRAEGPFSVFYNIQKYLMHARPSLLRVSEMCGVDLGIIPPKSRGS